MVPNCCSEAEPRLSFRVSRPPDPDKETVVLLEPSSNDQDQLWARMALDLLDKHRGLSVRVNKPTNVESGSAMFGDDKVTHPLPTSFYVKYLLTAGADNLMAVRSMLVAHESKADVQLTLHSFAPYTLVRTAIECAAVATWIMAPASRPERVFRTLVVELDDAWKSYQAFQSMNLDGEATYGQRAETLQFIAAKYPSISWVKVKKGYKITDVLGEVGALPILQSTDPLSKWQLASGMAHGKHWAGLLLSDKAPMSGYISSAGEETTYMMTGNYKHLVMFIDAAGKMLEACAELLLIRSTAHHKKQSVEAPV